MNAIIGFTALAAAHVNQPDQVQEYLNKISTSGQHLFPPEPDSACLLYTSDAADD